MGSTPDGRTSLWYSLTRIRAMKRRWRFRSLCYWGLLIYGATLGVRTPCGLAFEDERAEGRAIVRVHILDPAALATSSQALMSFWPYGNVRAGYVTIRNQSI